MTTIKISKEGVDFGPGIIDPVGWLQVIDDSFDPEVAASLSLCPGGQDMRWTIADGMTEQEAKDMVRNTLYACYKRGHFPNHK